MTDSSAATLATATATATIVEALHKDGCCAAPAVEFDSLSQATRDWWNDQAARALQHIKQRRAVDYHSGRRAISVQLPIPAPVLRELLPSEVVEALTAYLGNPRLRCAEIVAVRADAGVQDLHRDIPYHATPACVTYLVCLKGGRVGTRFVRGSHCSPEEAKDEDAHPLDPAPSAALFNGAVWHAGGAGHSMDAGHSNEAAAEWDVDRLFLNFEDTKTTAEFTRCACGSNSTRSYAHTIKRARLEQTLATQMQL